MGAVRGLTRPERTTAGGADKRERGPRRSGPMPLRSFGEDVVSTRKALQPTSREQDYRMCSTNDDGKNSQSEDLKRSIINGRRRSFPLAESEDSGSGRDGITRSRSSKWVEQV